MILLLYGGIWSVGSKPVSSDSQSLVAKTLCFLLACMYIYIYYCMNYVCIYIYIHIHLNLYVYRLLLKSIGSEILMDSNTSGLYGTRAPLFSFKEL